MTPIRRRPHGPRLALLAGLVGILLVSQMSLGARQGELVVFLRTSETPPTPVTVDVVSVEVVTVDGQVVPLSSGPLALSSDRFGPAGEELVRGLIAKGAYETLRLTLPAEGDEPAPVVDLIVGTRVRRNSATTIFLTWNPSLPLGVDSEAITARLEQPQLRSQLILVTNRGTNDLTVIQRHLKEVVGVIKVGREPMGIASDPTGQTVYVANSGSDTISVVDTQTRRVLDTLQLDFGSTPTDVAVSRDGRRLFVAAANRGSVLAFGTATLTEEAEARDVGVRPERLVVSPDGATVFVANRLSNSITVLEARTLQILRTIPVESQPIEMVVEPNRGRIFVSHGASDAVVVIDTNRTIANTLSFGAPIGGLAIDEAGRRLYLSAASLGRVLFSRPGIDTVTGFAPLAGPGRIVVDPDGKSIYVLEPEADRLRIVDGIMARTGGTIPTGKRPFDLVLLQ